MAAIELTNPDFELAVNFVCQTDKPIFLTGKAGTGKTTFLKYIREHCPKKMAVVAPTGVAAINAGGVTMHSFFQLPFGAFVAEYRNPWGAGTMETTNRHTLLKNLRLNHNKRQLIQELELLVIDEVSMLRADMLDAIDTVLRHIRQKPALAFGGVQVLFIGDLFQLPPVVSREEWQLLSAYYKSPFFFDAQVLADETPVCLELTKIYRQSDSSFIRLLNHIRNNEADAADMKLLERCYDPAFEPGERERYIILTSHNAKADIVNKTELEKLGNRLHVFEGVTKGDFGDKAAPVEKHMQLKKGAQVMFVKNDKGENRRYYNGKIAIVSRIEGDKIWVQLEDNTEMELEKETWRNINYRYNQEKDEVEEEELGSFTQYPVRLAWAITIHKSQGLTFEKAIVDAGASFAPGQVYVALSRLVSLEGLVLHTRIQPSLVMTDERILAFSQSSNSRQSASLLLETAQKQFAAKLLLESFDLAALSNQLAELYINCSKAAIPEKDTALSVCKHLSEQGQHLDQVAQKFLRQLQLVLEGEQDYQRLQERSQAAADYFKQELNTMNVQLRDHMNAWKLKARSKKYSEQLNIAWQQLQRKLYQIDQATLLADGLRKGTATGTLLQALAAQRAETGTPVPEVAQETTAATTPSKKEKGASQRISLGLYREGNSIAAIADIRSMAQSTIETHLTTFVATGEIEVTAFVSREQLSLIIKAIQQLEQATTTALKEHLGPEISFAQIRAVQAYHQRLQEQG